MTFYETRFIRAMDLTGDEVVKIDGTWRELLDVWKAGDDPLSMFAPDNEMCTQIRELIDYSSPVWVGLRYVVQEKCNADEIEDALRPVFVRDLVEVQVPVTAAPAAAGPTNGVGTEDACGPQDRTPGTRSGAAADADGSATTPVPVPAVAGELSWPVLAAVRVNNGDDPAEFVVVADCIRGGLGRNRYATLRLSVWPDGTTVTQRGRYNLTFTRALRSMLERAGLLSQSQVEIVVVRDPDAANDYTVFLDGELSDSGTNADVTVTTFDIDPGASGVTHDWVTTLWDSAGELTPAAAENARAVVVGYADRNDIPAP